MLKRLFIILFLGFLLVSCKDTGKKIEGYAFKTSVNGKWGIVSADGTTVLVPTIYDMEPSCVVNGMFTVPDKNGYFQLYNINRPQQPVTYRKFIRIGYFFEDVTIAQEDYHSPILIIDKSGNTVSAINYPQYDVVIAHNFSEGRALVVTRDNKYGFIDTKGTFIIPPIYDYAYDFHEGKSIVGITDKESNTCYEAIDKKGKVLIQFQQNNILIDQYFGDGLLMYKSLDTGSNGYLNSKGDNALSLPSNITDCYQFEDGYAVVQTDKGSGLINKKGEIILSPSYDDVFIAGNDRLFLQKGGKWALSDMSGKMLSEFIYDEVNKFNSHGLAVTFCNGEFHLLDISGRFAGKPYLQLSVSQIALHIQPEIFVRVLSDKESTIKHEQEPSLPNDTASDVIRKDYNAVHHQNPRSTNWIQISKESPFYEEARKVINGKLTEIDADNRKIILNYVENLRSSYTTKDIDFLNQLFSENALIVVGNVVRTASKETGYLSPAQVTYNVHSKQEYLSKLKLVFKSNKSIDVRFSNFHIMRHPTMAGIYGVTLRQKYTSDRYSDDGYLFLLWDFRNEAEPKIHVRTWQPYMTDNRTPLSEESVFSIRNFNLQ